ncbi:MAG TPA: NAD(P)/FAD-dependent oxidoreductase [Bacteroidales bacterium]|nr:NAD(P)/FAD-dependent oxidoreductase [Bacteroidales bacterium]
MVQSASILFCSFIAVLIIVVALYRLKPVFMRGKKSLSGGNETETHGQQKNNSSAFGEAGTDSDFETNITGIYVAGELGGMHTLNSAANHAGSAVGYIAGKIDRTHKSDYDLVIIGAGPAGISASLAAKLNNLRFILLEQDTLSGSIASNPKKNILVNGDIALPLVGKLRLPGNNKSDLIDLFHRLIMKYKIPIMENCRVESIIKLNNSFNVISSDLQNFTTAAVLLTIGKRGSPRRLNVPGETKEKVAYSITDIDKIKGERVLIVGGNDKAVESALILSGKNEVTIACRQEGFTGLTQLTGKLINKASLLGSVKVLLSSKVMLIEENHVLVSTPGGYIKLYNDLVFILHGGVSAENFLEKAGISATGLFVEEYHWQ